MQTPSTPTAHEDLPDVIGRAEAGDEDAMVELQTFADADILRRCAQSTDLALLHIVASNEATPDDVLEALAGTPDLSLQSAQSWMSSLNLSSWCVTYLSLHLCVLSLGCGSRCSRLPSRAPFAASKPARGGRARSTSRGRWSARQLVETANNRPRG